MKKWLIISAISLFLITIGVAIYTYSIVRSPLTDQLTEAEDIILASNQLETISNITYYHGSSSYFVANGIDTDGDEAFAWLLEGETEPTEVLKESAGITSEEAVAITESEMNPETIQSVKLGMEDNLPLYEVKYQTDNNHQGYYYLTFEDGSYIKRYSLRTD